MTMLLPGPVQTHHEVRAAMSRDIAPWHREFKSIHEQLKSNLLQIAQCDQSTHAAMVFPGPGHMTLEAAIRTFTQQGDRIAVPCNGQYSRNLARLIDLCGRTAVPIQGDDRSPADAQALSRFLDANQDVRHVAMVHHETSTGVINDADAIGQIARDRGRRLILDSISAFGAIGIDLRDHPECDCVILTSGKCLAGPPGMGAAICSIDALASSQGNAGSWTLDMHDIWKVSLEQGPGMHRFTPCTQVMLGFARAVERYIEHGGQQALASLCRHRSRLLRQGMIALGLEPYLSEEEQGPIVVVMHQPAFSGFTLEGFLEKMEARGIVISGFHGAAVPTFRVGCIGEISDDDLRACLTAMASVLKELREGGG